MSEEKVFIEYKGFKIVFEQWDSCWRIDQTTEPKNMNIRVIKDYIDNMAKKEFKRFTALLFDEWRGGCKPVEVTSIDESNNYWVKTDNGRTKVPKTSLRKHTDNNKILVEQLKEKCRQIKQIEQEMKDISNKFEKLD